MSSSPADGNIGSLLANVKITLRVTNQPKKLIILGSRDEFEFG